MHNRYAYIKRFWFGHQEFCEFLCCCLAFYGVEAKVTQVDTPSGEHKFIRVRFKDVYGLVRVYSYVSRPLTWRDVCNGFPEDFGNRFIVSSGAFTGKAYGRVRRYGYGYAKPLNVAYRRGRWVRKDRKVLEKAYLRFKWFNLKPPKIAYSFKDLRYKLLKIACKIKVWLHLKWLYKLNFGMKKLVWKKILSPKPVILNALTLYMQHLGKDPPDIPKKI